ncbi:hypothetical protein BDP27DRAFT_1415037 [Rhodocollybia butyracea]|uniref:F-box domain-containing protein n=1 Tax=Rhodocollybia butyracea TaxID=206335 RepID=A0A9P5Q758_9AGAR|nr:hypothetical protein BDP27DRAFT_1415037 [Rhodocollybia butyracea]
MLDLLQFPTELLYIIFEELDIFSLLQCTQVCKQIHSLLKDSLAVRYKTLLAVSGMRDGPPDTISTSERYEKLQAHQDAWNQLRWAPESLCYPMSTMRLWELAGGVLALYDLDQRLFKLVQLPSSHRGLDHREWEIHDIDIQMGDFTMNPSADLLVIVARDSVDLNKNVTVFKIRLLSLETGQPHPQARQPELLVESSTVDQNWTYEVRILDEHLAILFRPDDSDAELSAWNWNNGCMIKIFAFFNSFSFLTKNLIVLSSIWASDLAHETVPELVIIDLYDKEVDELGYSLHLPPLSFHWALHDLEIVTENPPISDWHSTAPFTTSMEDRLVVVNYRLLDIRGILKCYAVFIPLSVLIECLHKRGTEKSIPWNEWGPENTRMLPISFSENWMCYVHGMKASVYDTDHKQFRLYDFTKLAISYDLAKQQKQPDTQYLIRPTGLKAFGKEPIRTSLPVRIRTGTLPLESVNAVMVTEDCMVAACLEDDTMLHVYSL